jgi:hypothetical protein
MLGFFILITVVGNIWLGWILWSWIGILAIFALLPVIFLLMLGGWLALGLVGMVFQKYDNRTQSQRFLRNFLRWWVWLSLLIWILPGLSIGILATTNARFPATLPRITLSNGEKTVIFQSMMHIASPRFYANIRDDMIRLRGEDYVFLYEWVREGTPESLEKLSQLMGMDVSEKMYQTFADVAWLVYQGDEIYTDILPSTNVDLTTDDIVKLASTEEAIKPLDTPSSDIISMIAKKYPDLTDTQKQVAIIVAQGALNMLLRNYTRPEIENELKKTLPVFRIILDTRNELIVDTLIHSPNRHIYMHYGALHFPGILRWLQARDPRWHEVSRTDYVVIR